MKWNCLFYLEIKQFILKICYLFEQENKLNNAENCCINFLENASR